MLARVPKKPEVVEKAKLDYGKIAFDLLLNPINPYAWFVYLFVGIVVYGSTEQ
jgi:hypothetical protein